MIVLDTTAAADLNGVTQLRKSLRGVLLDKSIAPKASSDLQLVVSELGANIAKHSRPSATRIELEVALLHDVIVLTIVDDGGPFLDFGERLQHAAGSEPDPMAESGRGLGLVNAICAGIAYEAGPPNAMTVRYEIGRSATVTG